MNHSIKTGQTQDRKQDEPPPRRAPQVGRVRLLSDQQLIWHPRTCASRRLPVISLGAFKNGTPALHYRVYARKAPGEYAVTTAGISLSFDEYDEVSARVAEIRAALERLGLSSEATDAE